MSSFKKIAVLVLLLAPLAQAELVGLWHMNEGSGTQTADASSYGYHGSLMGAQWTTGGMSGNALVFDGVNDYVRIGNQPALDMDATMTLSAWIFPTGPGGGGAYGGIIINKEGEYEIARMASGEITWALNHGGVSWNWIFTGFVAPLNTWTHIALVYDGTSVKTYGNGVLQHTIAMTGAIGHESGYPGAYDFWIGARQEVSYNQFFQGKIDEVGVYNNALTASQITLLSQPVPEISCWLYLTLVLGFRWIRRFF